MSMWEVTLAEIESSELGAGAAEEAFHMDEQAFRVFYEKTARPLWSYLSRLAGDRALAEDLVQESYYRFLRAKLQSGDEAYQKNYLFRIGTNLARDHWRRTRPSESLHEEATSHLQSGDRTAESVQQNTDLGRALAQLKPRERELLWLAYVEGSSHKEIAEVSGLRAASIRLLLFRARRKLAEVLRSSGGGVESAELRARP
ncbi:MAG TPA: RNA polymerase sigma factor [Terriglobia bacterium]|jgi:RNA polymerase sigma-70 factor (ECF subfamily)|nr:RNA polymerase sigma factor [Terriglobia bacterium]